MTQFQPKEFSAIIGAEIWAVLAELGALLPLPLLFLSLDDMPGVRRPPDMKAPPIRAGLPVCLISEGFWIELERRWLSFRFLYLRAIKNMAAPYADAAAIPPNTIPAVVPLELGVWFCWSVLKTSLLVAEEVVAALEPV